MNKYEIYALITIVLGIVLGEIFADNTGDGAQVGHGLTKQDTYISRFRELGAYLTDRRCKRCDVRDGEFVAYPDKPSGRTFSLLCLAIGISKGIGELFYRCDGIIYHNLYAE